MIIRLQSLSEQHEGTDKLHSTAQEESYYESVHGGFAHLWKKFQGWATCYPPAKHDFLPDVEKK